MKSVCVKLVLGCLPGLSFNASCGTNFPNNPETIIRKSPSSDRSRAYIGHLPKIFTPSAYRPTAKAGKNLSMDNLSLTQVGQIPAQAGNFANKARNSFTQVRMFFTEAKNIFTEVRIFPPEAKNIFIRAGMFFTKVRNIPARVEK